VADSLPPNPVRHHDRFAPDISPVHSRFISPRIQVIAPLERIGAAQAMAKTVGERCEPLVSLESRERHRSSGRRRRAVCR